MTDPSKIPDQGFTLVKYTHQPGSPKEPVEWKFQPNFNADGQLVGVTFWFSCLHCTARYDNSSGMRSHGKNCGAEGQHGAARGGGSLLRGRGASTAAPMGGNNLADKEGSGWEGGGSGGGDGSPVHAVIQVWALPPPHSVLRQSTLMQQHHLVLRLDLGVLICIRPSCGTFVLTAKAGEHMSTHHKGWNKQLQSPPPPNTWSDVFRQDAQELLDSTPWEGKAMQLWMENKPPQRLYKAGRGDLLVIEEGGAVYRVLWCTTCDQGFKDRVSFLAHDHKDLPADQRMQLATPVFAQQLCRQPNFKGYFKVRQGL